MKRIDYLVLGLLTTCCAVLTNEVVSCHYFSSLDKLILTALWSGWLVVLVYYYFQLTKGWIFKHRVDGGWIVGLAVGIENTCYSKSINIVIPFMVLEFRWTKDHIKFNN
jgi:hypothetical protein